MEVHMETSLNLDKLEQRAWTAYFEDGLIDICLGLYLLGGGIRMLADNVWYNLLVLGGILVLAIGKRFITYPRLGRVKFGPSRRIRNRKALVATAVAIIASFVLIVFVLTGRAPSRAVTAPVFGFGFILLFGLIAYFTEFSRLYFYAFLLGITWYLIELRDNSVGPIASLIAGGIALVVGIFMLGRFIRRYPVLGRGEADDKS
jgi:hypothetical protein